MTIPLAPVSFDKKIQNSFFLIMCVAALLRIYMVTLDMNILLDQGLVQDDAFYYYVIARHIADSGYSSFDGINLTNGYHPLWQFISLPVFKLSSGDTPVRIMLGIACVLDLLSLVIFYNILNSLLKNRLAVLLGVAVLAFHGTIIRTWFNGLETALSIFSLLLLLQQFLKLVQSAQSITDRDHLYFGLIAAVAFLSRTDAAIIIVILFSFLYIPPLLSMKVKQGLLASSVCILLVGPWLTWNMTHFGSIVQISGQVRENTWLVDSAAGERSFVENIAYGISTTIYPLGNVAKKMFVPVAAPDLYGYIFLLPLILLVVLSRLNNRAFKSNWHLIFPFISGVMILFFYHTGIRHFVRGWYNAPVLLAFTLIASLLVDILLARFQQTRVHLFLVIATCAGLLIFYSPYRYTKAPTNLAADPRVEASRWINKNTPSDSVIGAANAGIVGYYTERPVINLDGVVNEGAFKARMANKLHQYITESGMNYIVDHKGSVNYLCSENRYFTCIQEASWDDSTFAMRIVRK